MAASEDKKLNRFARKRSVGNTQSADKPNESKERHNYRFMWKGVNKDGHKTDGIVLTTSAVMAKSILIKQGIRIDAIKKESSIIAFLNRRRIKKEDITRLTRQLATMVNAGIPIIQCFDIVTRGSNNIAFNDLILNIKSDVQAGIKLSHALEKHAKYFNQLFCALIEAGEESGSLGTMLERLATYMEKIEAIKRKIKKALFYPIAVITIGLVVSGILLLKVIPQFKTLFSSFGANLPPFTAFVLNLSDWVGNNIWHVVIGIAIAAFIYYHVYKRSRRFRRLIDKITLKIPVMGIIFTKSILARFARTLATTFSAGMPLVESMRIVARAPDNIIYEEAIDKARRLVTEGRSLHTSLEATDLFPNILVQMVAIGEESGELDQMLNKAAQVYEEEVDNAVDALSTLIEPMIMAILGVLVGGLVIAMYLPIFKLSDVVSR